MVELYKTPEGRQKIVDWYHTAVDRIDAELESVWADTRFGRTHMLAAGKKTGLQARGGRFSSSDVVTLGLSAFFFDESEAVDDYLIWMRHDGPRRWFVGSIERPVTIRFDDNVIQPAPLHRSALAGESNDTPLIEKLEFTLRPSDLESISTVQQVVIEVTTLLGTVAKTLSAEEIGVISEFSAEARERHDEIRSSESEKT